jgi:plasmid stability protein
MRKTNVTLDDETFEEIAARARAARHSFCAEVRDLLEVGLETAKAAGV